MKTELLSWNNEITQVEIIDGPETVWFAVLDWAETEDDEEEACIQACEQAACSITLSSMNVSERFEWDKFNEEWVKIKYIRVIAE